MERYVSYKFLLKENKQTMADPNASAKQIYKQLTLLNSLSGIEKDKVKVKKNDLKYFNIKEV